MKVELTPSEVVKVIEERNLKGLENTRLFDVFYAWTFEEGPEGNFWEEKKGKECPINLSWSIDENGELVTEEGEFGQWR